PIRDVLRYAEGVGSALETAHAHDILHRDLKPSNVLVTADGRALLTDFGLAQLLRTTEASTTRSRDSEVDGQGIAGTPRYMAPEQILGKPLDRRSDIFSFGAVLYEMCTGRPAFSGNDAEILNAILHREPIAISRLNYEAPEELDRIVRKALAKDPEERYQNARDLLVDVRALRRRIDHAAYADEHAVDGGRHWKRPTMAWATTLVVTGAAVAVVVVVLTQRRASAPVPASPASVRIGVLMPHNISGSTDTAAWPEIVQALFVSELMGVESLAVVDPLWLNGVIENEIGEREPPRGPDLYKVFRNEALAFVIDGRITPTREGHRLQSNVVEPSTGEVRSSHDSVVTAEARLPEAVTTAAKSFLAFLESEGLTVVADKDLRPWFSHGTRNLEALKAFLLYSKYALRHEPGGAKYLVRAMELDPTFVTPRIWCIPGLVSSGRIDEALEHQRVLLKLFPTASPFEQAMIEWAGAFLEGDPAAEVQHLETALEYAPGNNILLVNLAETRLGLGDFDGALGGLEPALRLRWRYPYLYTLQGAALIGTGKFAEAKQALHLAVDISPVDAGVYGMLYALHRRDREIPEAERYRRLYTSRAQELGWDPTRQHEELAGHMISVGMYGGAAEILREAIAMNPARPSSHARLGEALYKAGKAGEAIRHYSRALELDPKFSEAHVMLGKIHEAQGSFQAAMQHYERFLASGRKGPLVHDAQRRLERLRSTTPAAAPRR
ncbi:MAG TPA: tetratricopeptide repeat protein, partial [Vicinamibacteria bacterium]|nr:tetratricopeptide repeat protein [Vicinamibacteria bacterium]